MGMGKTQFAPIRNLNWTFFRIIKKHILTDVRILQILLMGGLLVVGAGLYDFSLTLQQVFLTFLFGLSTQWFWIKKYNLPNHSLLSASITCLGLSLLLRSSVWWAHPAMAILAISSKFVFKWQGRHIFNPSALGVMVALVLLPNCWASPGQWGSEWMAAVWLVALGLFAVQRAHRPSISLWFLLFYLSCIMTRNLYFGYEWSILVHKALNGSLLLFSFFMISDPKTSPDHYLGQVLQAAFVAILASIFHLYFFKNNGFIYILLLSNLFVPMINQILKASKFSWRSPTGGVSEVI